MLQGNNSDVASEIWVDDVLDRKQYAEFLTKFLNSQVQASGDDKLTPYCLALDADWGAGKTFFVDKWVRHLQETTAHPAFKFDAWSSDFQSDPLISFLAAFRKVMHSEIEKAGLVVGKVAEAKGFISRGATALAAAAIPLTMDVAFAVAKGLAPGAVNAIKEVWEADDISDVDLDTDQLRDDALDGAKKGATKYFEKALKEQEKKGELLRTFRDSVASALKVLQSDGKRSLPYFVFIDELDRCRPTYAIEMLENIKHIFNIPGLCFIVSTNMHQLANATGAVYGAKFDGRDYLQRFFDLECALPAPSGAKFAEVLVNEFPLLKARKCIYGYPMNGFTSPQENPGQAAAFNWAASSFALDLRSQRKMVMMLNACIASIGGNEVVAFLFLCVLCAARIRSSELFENISRQGPWSDKWDQVVPHDVPRKCRVLKRNSNLRDWETKDTTLKMVVSHYVAHMSLTSVEFSRWFNQQDMEERDFPDRISSEIWDAMSSGGVIYHDNSPMFYCKYPNLVRLAGHVAS